LVLKHFNRIALLKKLTVPALTVFGVGLLTLGVNVLAPNVTPQDLDNGMGGPAEAPLSQVTSGQVSLSMDKNASGEDALVGAYLNQNLTADAQSVLPAATIAEDLHQEMCIKKNQTFYEALEDLEVSHEDIMAIVKACKPFRNLTSVKIGEIFIVEVTDENDLKSLRFDLDEESFIIWNREGDTYVREDGNYPVERRVKGIHGTITHSLYASLQNLHAPLALAPKMNDILGWDIDFTRDLRKGDTFRILYEEVWRDGEFVRTGTVLAAELINAGKERQAFRYKSKDERTHYFDAQGNNMQKQLMRAPLEYSRISSKFSYRRFHPVLKKWMPHLGIDYAAPTGTPVKAAGDGVIVKARKKKGNGRYVQIRHTNREYETYYLHLSRYGKGIKEGTKVTQGQIIGYVGATGYATGPHLDFRVKRNGKFINPRKMKSPAAKPVPEAEREDFLAGAGDYLKSMDQLVVGAAPATVFPGSQDVVAQTQTTAQMARN
jgi:murein DD-endopeptidase MepM/ murein hydrolase activator NlpD